MSDGLGVVGDLTILVIARDAADTVERAIASCRPEACPIVLVDDHSRDDTVARARAMAGSCLTVVEAPDPGGVGVARQCALETAQTEFAAWLDADDEWIPGRAARFETMLDAGSDVVAEAIDLVDGPSGAWLRLLTVPDFLRRPGAAVRLFERNFLPGDTQIGFRTRVLREVGGYDRSLRGAEGLDVLLRAVRAGARTAFGDEVGYRMHAYPGSLSRNLQGQRMALASALRKHDYADIRRLYEAAGYTERVAMWALVMVAQFRNEGAAALAFIDQASPNGADLDEILEPAGPWPFREGWRRAFHRGTALLALGDHKAALGELARAEAVEATAEGANNMGVALARLGRRAEALSAFAAASGRFPGYLDATLNAAAALPSHITSHPLRRAPSRIEYAERP